MGKNGIWREKKKDHRFWVRAKREHKKE